MNDKPNFVEYTPRPLTEEERVELRAIAERPDSEIDFSDIPATTAKDWEGAIRNPFLYPPVEMSADVIEFFQKKVGAGGSIMMEINHVLLDYIAQEKKKAAKQAG
jgi:uncharacterized protein (DUF4415 family)